MNVLWVMMVAGVLMLIEMAYMHIFALRRIRYERFFTKRELYCGEEVEMVEIIANHKLTPVPWLRMESRMSASLRFGAQENLDIREDLYHRSVFFLRSHRRIRRRHRVTCTRRGYFNMDSVTMTAGDLLGLWSQSRQLDLSAELVVYPRLMNPDELPIPSRKWQGDVIVRRWILPDPYLINGIREYRHGDTLRDVHWGATARTGALQVKTRDYTASPRLMLVINVQLTQDQWGELNPAQRDIVEGAFSIAATLARWATDNGVDAGLCCNGVLTGEEKREILIEPSHGEGHLALLMETMARIIIRRRKSLHSYIDETLIAPAVTGLDILIVSAYWSDLLEERAQALRRQGNAVVHVPVGGAS
jgi:uncharacterized protein (DUF58 family)